MGEPKVISDAVGFKKAVKDTGSNLCVVHFSATWAPQCAQMNDVVNELAKDSQFSSTHFFTLEAEDVPEISEEFSISAVPTFIFIKNGNTIGRLDGANAAELTKKVKLLSSESTVSIPDIPNPPKQDLNTRLKQLINSEDVMLFMKGNPEQPKCGFSRQIVQILNDAKVKFGSFDILQDEEVRQGLKTFSNWPTYPQLYAKGELLGGLDIVKELAESGELESQLPTQTSIEDRLKGLINTSPVMLFMKGDREMPRCGFSKQAIAMLNDSSVEYKTFDILSDEDVRQNLKKYSNWPTYPQLYVKGELVGGLDIMKELNDSGELGTILKEG
ncbi:glutaredoxin-3-like [Ruditapes philippinarum]|uniref:glutaredoxin-3-like n=1 Tax=Ruditapes philippinarum TaxID=129788 RepID=UPI00295C0B00|nr:glutaredoxin-3-like [Ruditapes philippinarum]